MSCAKGHGRSGPYRQSQFATADADSKTMLLRMIMRLDRHLQCSSHDNTFTLGQKPWIWPASCERDKHFGPVAVLSDLDSASWADFVGFIPAVVEREVAASNNADLLLVAEDGRRVVVEVKLGHDLGAKQQASYEKLPDETGLYLAALTEDTPRLAEDLARRWGFLSLAELFTAWTGVAAFFRAVAGAYGSLVGCDSHACHGAGPRLRSRIELQQPSRDVAGLQLDQL
jgi:hypothetical protein